jgi:ketosteroid isomerase-like protein
MSAEANKAFVAEFFATFSSGNVPAILDMMDDAASWWVSGRLEGLSGSYSKADFGPLLEGAKALYVEKALRITPTSMIAEGDKVAVEAEGHAALNGGGVYAPGYHFLVTLKDGKIFEVREYMDTAHARDVFFAS